MERGKKDALSDRLELLRIIQKVLQDRENAVCLAAKTDGEYKEATICGKMAEARRHSVSRAAYLSQIAESGFVLSTLPIDAPHVAHQTIAGGRIAGKRLEEINHIRPKPTPIKDAATWHFACGEHDDWFKPIDKGIVFPSCHEYMRIQTEGTTGIDKELEEALFLMAYRSVLSSLSILRGARNALHTLRLSKGNHPKIRQQASEISRSISSLMDYKRHYDGRFAGIQYCNMTHHVTTVQPHTRLAMSTIGTYGTIKYAPTNILPDSSTTRIVVSHLATEAKESQQDIVTTMGNLPKELSDPNNKKPFIDLVAKKNFEVYIAPADYAVWPNEDKEGLAMTAADHMRQFLSI